MGPDSLRGHVRRMAAVLRPRGPDDEGDWVDPRGEVGFAFRRLSILDLSAAGHQPMVSGSGRYTMVFNGEVYNFEKLRRNLQNEGVSFRSGSDSEVVLAAVESWGLDKALPQFVGMFAIALWDDQLRELVLIRDRMGIKPLYIAQTSGGIAFASELGALTRAPGFEAGLDAQAVQTYLRYLFVPAPRTPIESVQKVVPGHVLKIRQEHLRGSLPASEPYWTLEQVREQGLARRAQQGGDSDVTLSIDQLETLLSDAVRLRMIADVPVGALLSGGIDSSLVVSLMQRHTAHAVRTFTIGFEQPEHDESESAGAIARYLGTEHHALRITEADALSLVPALPDIFDEPLADPSQIPTFLVSKLAREQVTVALSGDGGDELFGGYNRYGSASRLSAGLLKTPLICRRFLRAAFRAVPHATWNRLDTMGQGGGGRLRLMGQKAQKFSRMLNAESAGELYRVLLSTSDDSERFMPSSGTGWDPIRAALSGSGALTIDDMLLLDQAYYLPDDLLQKVDRASMATSLEVRVPLLDHRVVAFSWTLPDDLKIRDGETKWLLRQVLHRNVPEELVNRPKTGFSVPVASWLRGSLRDWAEFHLFENSSVRDEIFDSGAVRAAWKRLSAGDNTQALGLWAIIMFEVWRHHWKLEDIAGVPPIAERLRTGVKPL